MRGCCCQCQTSVSFFSRLTCPAAGLLLYRARRRERTRHPGQPRPGHPLRRPRYHQGDASRVHAVSYTVYNNTLGSRSTSTTKNRNPISERTTGHLWVQTVSRGVIGRALRGQRCDWYGVWYCRDGGCVCFACWSTALASDCDRNAPLSATQ